MPLPPIPWLTDNPFRALAVGSALPLPQLRQRIRGAVRDAQVGLAPEPALRGCFGDVDWANTASIVAALVRHPDRLVHYRTFWPLEFPNPVIEAGGGGAARPPDDPAAELVWVETIAGTTGYHHVQLGFLCSWVNFLALGTPAELGSTLNWLEELFHDRDLRDTLVALAGQDGWSSDDLYNDVVGAQLEGLREVLSVAMNRAAELWRDGEPDRALVCLVLITFTRWWAGDDLVAKVHPATFHPLGDALCEEVGALEIPSGFRLIRTAIVLPDSVRWLATLAQAMQWFSGSSHGWREAVETYVAALTDEVLNAAHRFVEARRDFDLVEEALTQLLELKELMDEECHDQLEQHLQGIRSIRADLQQASEDYCNRRWGAPD